MVWCLVQGHWQIVSRSRTWAWYPPILGWLLYLYINTHTHTSTHIPTPSHPHTHTHTHTRAHTHKHTHTRTRTVHVNLSWSLVLISCAQSTRHLLWTEFQCEGRTMWVLPESRDTVLLRCFSDSSKGVNSAQGLFLCLSQHRANSVKSTAPIIHYSDYTSSTRNLRDMPGSVSQSLWCVTVVTNKPVNMPTQSLNILICYDAWITLLDMTVTGTAVRIPLWCQCQWTNGNAASIRRTVLAP